MRFEESTGQGIKSMEDWQGLYEKSRKLHHWKPGRSAYSIADFMLNHHGGNGLQDLVSEAIGQAVVLERCVPEFEQRFDAFGRGRVHDLAVFGRTASGERLFVGVEAKVDETFGETVGAVYLQAKARRTDQDIATNVPERIERLVGMHCTDADAATFDVRYQLLYATAGTLAAQAEQHVLVVFVFKTPLYDETVGASNLTDYLRFMEKVGATSLELNDAGVIGHRLQVGGRPLIALHQYVRLVETRS